ncbi:TPA: fibronectin type III domain-containing protein [Enterococcus faecalis]|nr:fibronectin type III domain-containing protein [Enterococcus faecalis]
MALPKTGYTKTTADNFVIDSATVFTDFKYDKEKEEFTGIPMGATSGGVEIKTELSYRKVEVDGAYIMDVVGLNVLESATATMKANLIELTAENLRRSLNATMTDATTDEAPAGYKIIKPKRYLEEGDYIPNMAVVGIHNGTKQPIIVALDNGLVKSGLEIKTEDGKEVVIEQEITANASYEQLINDEFPFRIYYPGTSNNPVPVRPEVPKNVQATVEEDGAISVSWASDGSTSYVIHYSGANQSEPSQATMMGYSETNNWKLLKANIPSSKPNDQIFLYVQGFSEVGQGLNYTEKAAYLNEHSFGSEWSTAVSVTIPAK